MTEILRAHRWGTNADLIADAAVPLGYVEPMVLDATYGVAGGFWTRHQPLELVTNDRYSGNGDYASDFRALPFDDQAFTTVVFDPPYKLNGTPAMGEMDARFGVGDDEWPTLNRDEKMAMIRDGAVECWRVASRILLVKCMDQVEGGKMRWADPHDPQCARTVGCATRRSVRPVADAQAATRWPAATHGPVELFDGPHFRTMTTHGRTQ